MATTLTRRVGGAGGPDRSAFFQKRAPAQRPVFGSWRAAAWLGAAAFALAAFAAHPEEGVVRAVVDGDTVELAAPVDGATEVRLVGIQAPKLPLGRPGFPTWPLAPEAKAGLESLVAGRSVRLVFEGEREDRHRRLLAQLHVGATWVQGEMLRLGLARVYTFPDNRARAADMLALEREARAASRGIWGHPFYRVRSPEGLGRDVDTFQLVAGTVVKATETRNQLFLNFGEDWRRDFTVVVARQSRRLFRDAGMDLLALEGRRVRVRGWLKELNGPSIDLTHPEQIELGND